MKKVQKASAQPSATELISQRIAELAGWRGETLARMRKRIRAADRSIVEEWKWGGPVWTRDGIVCTGEVYKEVVKFTFAHGAALADPARLFNASLTGNTRRALDLREGEDVDAAAFQALVRAAVAHNRASAGEASERKAATRTRKPARTKSTPKPRTAGKAAPVLLSGGNPQIAKGDGDAPVQAYLAAMPGWKREVGRRLDALLTRTLPEVQKAVKWNSPFYGLEGQGWFLAFHCFTKYVKVSFLRGSALRPPPPIASKDEHARYLHIHADGAFDEAQVARWIRQAAQLPGWMP